MLVAETQAAEENLPVQHGDHIPPPHTRNQTLASLVTGHSVGKHACLRARQENRRLQKKTMLGLEKCSTILRNYGFPFPLKLCILIPKFQPDPNFVKLASYFCLQGAQMPLFRKSYRKPWKKRNFKMP